MTTEHLLLSAGAVLLLILLRWLSAHLVHRRVTDPHARYRWSRGLTSGTVLLGAGIGLRIWGVDFGGFATYLGLLSAGLAIALKDPIANFTGWLYILWRRPFEVGDRVQLGDHAGDVVDIRLFQFTLLEIGHWVNADQHTGRLIYQPNASLFTTPVVNYTRGFRSIWTELPVLITFESDWRKARALLQEIADRHGGRVAEWADAELAAASVRYALPKSTTDPTVYLSVEASGVLLTLRTPCDPRARRDVTDAIWQDVLTAFEACPTIELAYPTTRWYTQAPDRTPEMPPPARS